LNSGGIVTARSVTENDITTPISVPNGGILRIEALIISNDLINSLIEAKLV
jgi:hypothetical protein